MKNTWSLYKNKQIYKSFFRERETEREKELTCDIFLSVLQMNILKEAGIEVLLMTNWLRGFTFQYNGSEKGIKFIEERVGFTDEFLQQVLNDRGKDIMIHLIKIPFYIFIAFFGGGGGCYKKLFIK